MQKTKIYILTSILITLSLIISGQTIEKSFQGWWAKTRWTFNFHSNGTFKIISFGHFDNSEITGNYKLVGDTIKLLSDLKQMKGVVSQKLLLEKQGMLIDIGTAYDYAAVTYLGKNNYNSKKRKIKK